jgi:anaerobic selenocysteine-containing dehydrogenase
MSPLKKNGLSIGRREFLAGLGGVGVGLGLGKASHWFPLASPEIGKDWAPGQEGAVSSTCLLCPSHCGILGRVVDGNLVRIDGNPLHPVSRGGLCPKGIAGLQMLYHPDRLTGALERTGTDSQIAPVAWDVALERIAERMRSLREAGRPDAVAWLGGEVTGCLGEIVERFVGAYGSPHRIQESYGDGSEDVMEIVHGIRERPAFDLDRADLVLSFGVPLSEAWWCLPQAARARAHEPTEPRPWLQVDTRLSRTAIGADEWFPIRPGAYGDLAVSIAYVLLKEGLYDSEFVRDHIAGFEDWNGPGGEDVQGFRNLVLRHGRPDDVAERIGLPADEIVRLAKLFGRARRPVAVWDNVIGWSRAGLASSLAIHALNVLAGSIQRPGGVFFQPSLPLPQSQESSPAIAPSGSGSGRSLRGDDWADRVLDPDEPPVEVLFLHYSNPVASAPNPDKIRRALERIPLVVSFSPFLDESARLAHLVLPDHTYLERWQDAPAPATVPYSAWGIVRPIVPPLHDTRATGDVVLDLASRIGGSVEDACPWPSMEALVRERGKALAAAHRGSAFVTEFRAAELRELEARGWWLPHEESLEKYWEIVRESGGWFDPFHDDHGRASASEHADGRLALFPMQARRRIAGGVPGLVEGFLPLGLAGAASGGAAEDGESESEYPLRLLPYRAMTLASGTTSLTPWLLERLGPLTSAAWETWVEINPKTGRALGLVSGDRVRVTSARGDFTAQLLFFEGAQPGAVNVPYGLHSAVRGWPRPDRTNPLAAVGDRRAPVSGLPDWYSTRVRIDPA